MKKQEKFIHVEHKYIYTLQTNLKIIDFSHGHGTIMTSLFMNFDDNLVQSSVLMLPLKNMNLTTSGKYHIPFII